MKRPGWRTTWATILAGAALAGVVGLAVYSFNPEHSVGTGVPKTQPTLAPEEAAHDSSPLPGCTQLPASTGTGASPDEAGASAPAGTDVGAGLLPGKLSTQDEDPGDAAGEDDVGSDGLGDGGSAALDPSDSAAPGC